MQKLKLAKAAVCAILILLFIWPAIYNNQPLFSRDTSAYIRGFDAGIVRLLGHESTWTTWASALSAKTETVGQNGSFQSPSFIIGGRSVLYGALLYLGHILRGFWATIAIQASVALAAVALTLRHFRSFDWTRLIIVAGALGTLTSLPFFASFLLPDLFAGLAILAVGNLVAFGHKLKVGELVFWAAVLSVAAIFHPSHLALVGALLLVSVAVAIFLPSVPHYGIAAIGIALIIGMASELIFSRAVEYLTGASPARPPVVMARIIADGPGASYLRKNCTAPEFVACEFSDHLVTNSDAFLWDTSPNTGIYSPAPKQKRRALGDEQYRFAAAVFVHYPIASLAALARDAGEQLAMIGVGGFPGAVQEAYPSVPQSYAKAILASPMGRDSFSIAISSGLIVTTLILSLMFIVAAFATHWKRLSREIKIICLVAAFGILTNAVVCGALSGPHERYQSRLTWLIPLLALLTYCELESDGIFGVAKLKRMIASASATRG